MDWRPVQGVPCLRSMSAGIGSSAPATLMRISGIDNGWMDIYIKYNSHRGHVSEVTTFTFNT